MAPRFRKIVRYTFAGSNILIIALYLLACLVPFLDPGKLPYIALTGLIFPLLFLLLLLFTVYWLIKRSKWALLCIAVLLMGWQQVPVFFSWHTGKTFTAEKKPGTLRVLSWNLSGWGETARGDGISKLDTMVNLIKNSNADVICLQEFLYYKDSHYHDSIIPALQEMGYRYAYFAKQDYTGGMYTTLVLTGIEIMSKYPITGSGKIFYDNNENAEPLIYADITVNNSTIRFFTTHLESVRFGTNDYAALHNLKNPAALNIVQSRVAGGKLKIAYKKRVLQAKMLHQKISESPYPVIVCGDFNDVPNSFTYFTVKGNLQDAFLKKGAGFGRTFRFISQTLRIDYILADKKFDVLQYNSFHVPFSDHYPVVADFGIGEKY